MLQDRQLNLYREVMRLALPFILGNVTIWMLSFVDLSLMGGLDASYFGGVTLGSQVFNIIYWAFGFLRMGTGGLCAQAYGANDKEEVSAVLVRALLVSLVVGVLLLMCQSFISQCAFAWMSGESETKLLAKEYFAIRIYAAPAAISIFVFSGWFLGIQNAKTTLWITILVNCCNLLVSSLLVLVFDQGHRGVAIGTVLAQYTGLTCYLIVIIRKRKYYLHSFLIKSIRSWYAYKSFFRISSTLFVRTLCIIGVFTFYISESAAQGDYVLNCNKVISEMILFVSLFMDGLAQAAEALVGRFAGEKNLSRMRACIRYVFRFSLLIAISLSLLYFFFGGDLLAWMTRGEPQVYLYAKQYLVWLFLIPLVSFASFIWDGIFVGMTRTKAMLTSVLIGCVVFFFPFYYLCTYFCDEKWQNHILLGAMLGFMLVRAVVLTLLYPRSVKVCMRGEELNKLD